MLCGIMARDYKKEYNNYHKRPEQKKRRAGRNLARSIAKRKLGAKAIAGKDIDHKDRNPKNNSAKNLRVQSKSANRSRNG